MTSNDTNPVTLESRNGKVWATFDDGPAVEVKILKARPVTDPLGTLCALDDKKKEVATWASLESIPEPSKTVAREALGLRYVTPEITRVLSLRHWAGNYWWQVETDRGPRHFVVKSPHKNIQALGQGLMIKDVLGNRFLITSIMELDPPSRRHVERVL